MQGGANHKPKVVCFTRIRACTRWSQALVQFRGQGLYGAHKDSSDFYFLFFKKKLKGKASLSKNETPTRLVGTTFFLKYMVCFVDEKCYINECALQLHF
jgi:hypothetical protein